MFSRKACYFFVRPKKYFLEVCIFLGRTVKAPQVRKVVRGSRIRSSTSFISDIATKREAPVTDWLEEAYEVSDSLSAKGRGAKKPKKAPRKKRRAHA